MLSWDDYDNNTEETAVVNEAALQQQNSRTTSTGCACRRGSPAPVSPEPRRRHQRRLF